MTVLLSVKFVSRSSVIVLSWRGVLVEFNNGLGFPFDSGLMMFRMSGRGEAFRTQSANAAYALTFGRVSFAYHERYPQRFFRGKCSYTTLKI